MKKTLIAVVGPTAIGKTSWAIELARYFGTEIISTDSRQFYSEMKIGTAVPSKAELAEIRHHFIQHRSIQEPWSVGDFEKAALRLLQDLYKNRELLIAVGGSGLYMQALAEGLDEFPEVDPAIRTALNEEYKSKGLAELQLQLEQEDPEYYGRVDLQNPHRLIRALEVSRTSGRPYSSYLKKSKISRPFRTLYLGIEAPREEVYDRIEKRVDKMMESGLLEEARGLFAHKELKAMQTVGYQELFRYFEGEWELDRAVAEIKKNTRRFAKRQLTWLRKNDAILWIGRKDPIKEVVNKIENQLKSAQND